VNVSEENMVAGSAHATWENYSEKRLYPGMWCSGRGKAARDQELDTGLCSRKMGGGVRGGL